MFLDLAKIVMFLGAYRLRKKLISFIVETFWIMTMCFLPRGKGNVAECVSSRKLTHTEQGGFYLLFQLPAKPNLSLLWKK